MTTTDTLPAPGPGTHGQVVVLEARAGAARRAALDAWCAAARADGATAWSLSCDVARRGIWSGLNDWMESLLPALEAGAPDLVRKHDREITAVLPELKRRLRLRHPTLTETAEHDEAVRNFALDRAYRLPHGVIDLLAAWQARAGGGPWAVAADAYDRAGALTARFLRELMRRRCAALRLTLVVAVDPGAGDEAAAGFAAAGVPVRRAAADVPADAPEPEASPAEMTRRAMELESRVGDDMLEAEIHIHELIRLWTASEHPRRALAWHGAAVGLYNHLGYYEDALRHADPVEASLPEFRRQDHFHGRQNLVGNLCNSFIPVGQVDRALRLVETEVLAKVDDPEERARALYKLSMIWARHHPSRDLERGEAYLREGLRELDRATAADGDPRHFLRVFLNNGLAFILHRKGRPREAVALTHEGSATLDAHLPADRHRLHRSVLLYNAAQVYAGTGAHGAALDAFSAAMEMDPGYSEYYNERGNVYFEMGRLAEAERDYLAAIECSAPYCEVWVNLGQCYRAMGRPADADRAFGRALDLDPSRHLAWIGRAQARAELGDAAGAVADYDAAIALDDGQPLVFANRAVQRYVGGDAEGALDDLDRAIALAPAEAALFRNRAVAHRSLDRRGAEAADLRTYLRLAPHAPDAGEVRGRLHELASAPVGAA